MKKTLGFAVCALGIFAAAGNAEAARQRFWGGMVITASSAGCSSSEINEKLSVRFRPAGLGDGTTSTIALFHHDSARHFEVNGLFNSTFKTVTAKEIFDYASTLSNPVSVRFSTQSPAAITTATLNIVVTGQIKGWIDQPTCTLTFRMVLTKRVES